MAFAEWLHTTVLWPVAHRQVVLTIPKMLRAYFRYDRRLLGNLCRVAAEAITRSFRVLLGKPLAEPGLVVCVHSFGNLLNFHPHLHVMTTDGGFTADGAFHPLPTMSLAPIEGLFRHRVFTMLMRKGLLTPERVNNFEIFDPLDLLAAVTSHIPTPRRASGPVLLSDDAPHAKAARASWARFIKEVFAADPLLRPDWGGAMRIVAFIEERRVVRAILVYPSPRDEPRPPPALPAAPRAPVELEYLPWVE